MTLQELIKAAKEAIKSGHDTATVVDRDMRAVDGLVATTNEDGDDVIVVTSSAFEMID